MDQNKLELVVTVEVDRANQSIKSVNASLSSMALDPLWFWEERPGNLNDRVLRG